MSLLGKKIKLKGITQKGKNRIRENGDEWNVFAETDRVLFAPNQTGQWLFIAPIGKDQDHKASRWIRFLEDPDFDIVL